MGQIYMDDQDVLQDEKATPVNSNNDVGLEEDDLSGTTASKHKEFEKVIGKHSLILDVRRPDNSRRCSQNARSCSNELTILDHINFSSLDTDLTQYCGATEYGASDSPNIFHRTASFFKIPVNLRSMEFFIKSLKRHRRIKSANYTVECTLEPGTGNLIVSPLGQWVSDSMERTGETRSLMKSSHVSHLGAAVCSTSTGRAISFNLTQTNSSELTSSPSGLCRNLAQEPETNIIHLEKWNSELKISDKILVSCAHTKPACSHEYTSAAKHFGSKAQLQCKWKNGTPHFVFTVGDDFCEIYMANPHKIKSSIGEALDYIYLFHSMAGSKTEFRNCGANASDFVGKMKVSSSLILNANWSKIMETKFVLFAANSDHSREMQNSASALMKHKGLPKKEGGIFRPSHSPKHKSTCSNEIRPQSKGLSGELCPNEVSNYDKSDLVNHLESNCTPDLELAAIIIKDYLHDNSIETATGGWGLKFLEKATVSHADASLEPSLSFQSSEENHGRNGGEPAKRLNVLVPAGFHGGPITRIGGPSSLIERWRSGGHCDCGGWDIGCPLTILNNNSNSNNSIHSKSLPLEEQQEDCNSVNLFIEGTRQRKPVLKMVDMNNGQYFIYFQSTLSALQSFSIALSIIHSQIPALYQ